MHTCVCCTQIISRLETSDEYVDGAVKVQYLDEDAEQITYGITEFLGAADPAPSHINIVDVDEESSVAIEQKAFVPQVRGELLPLQRKPVTTPSKWEKNVRKFDLTFGDRVDESGEHRVPVCTVKNCSLDCKKLTTEIVQHARSCLREAAIRGPNDVSALLRVYARNSPKVNTPKRIWSHYVRDKVQTGREHFKCGFCKVNPEELSAQARADPTHMFKKTSRKNSKYAACPDYDAGVAFKKQVLATDALEKKRMCYFVPDKDGLQYNVHRPVFQSVFNLGWRALGTCKRNSCSQPRLDGRSGKSGRRPHQELRDRIEHFWLKEVELETSHYDANSTKQFCVNLSSCAHGYITFLAKYFEDKYRECVNAQYFPGITKSIPPSLPKSSIPIMACDCCIQRVKDLSLDVVVCPHVPKYSFFFEVSSKFKLTFKRPGADQCEKCNSLNDKLVMLHAMGRHRDAEALEDRMAHHREAEAKKEQAAHHNRAASFKHLKSGV